ncbi:hypothetical protein ACFQB0_10565 [Luethyella okanaganae]|uniref:Uncharacterized protein n=1 Tax=Luethyella okanaganae TaxID=69372 RepID=A0ABW1VF68_9MICO
MALVGTTELFIPNLVTGGLNHFAIAYALPVLPILVWCVLSERSQYDIERVTLRRWNVAFLDLSAIVFPPLIVSIWMLNALEPITIAAGRNLVFYVCMGLAALGFTRRYFAFVPTVLYLLVCSTAGFGYSAVVPFGWAFVLGEWDPARNIPTLWIALGVSVIWFLSRRVPG